MEFLVSYFMLRKNGEWGFASTTMEVENGVIEQEDIKEFEKKELDRWPDLTAISVVGLHPMGKLDPVGIVGNDTRSERAALNHLEQAAGQLKDQWDRDRRDALLRALFKARDLVKMGELFTWEIIQEVMKSEGFSFSTTGNMGRDYRLAAGIEQACRAEKCT